MMKYFIVGLLISLTAMAYQGRWVKGEAPNNLSGLLEKIATEEQVVFTSQDFFKTEEIKFRTSKFIMYSQMINNIPVYGSNIRMWTHLETQLLIQAEAALSETIQKKKNVLVEKMNKALFSPQALKSKKLENYISEKINSFILRSYDSQVRDYKTQDYWMESDLVRRVKVTARRGTHIIDFSLFKNRIIKTEYKEFPRQDAEISLPANVYPIYEEVEGTGEKLDKIKSELKYVNTSIREVNEDPFLVLKNRRYDYSLANSLLALTLEGQASGYWSTSVIKNRANRLIEALPFISNSFESGLRLDGRYVTINIHPEVKKVFSGVNYELKNAATFLAQWKTTENGGWEMIPNNGLLGKPVFSFDEIINRTSNRDLNHDPVYYMNEGFDETQVYWAVTSFMESLHHLTFTDEELSTRRFHAFLYDPDIEMKDNAYYTNDTINFTTYSPEAINYARDNSTIWHELGHGIMDRLMGEGDLLQLTDTGGLSEGMADFLAQIVVMDVMKGVPFAGADNFRIINRTGFNLTNEVHDDGEAYGGAMYDMLVAAQEKFGFDEGLKKMSDLTFETMRYCRSHQSLDANGWFNHMLFSDELGSNERESFEFKEIILKALDQRNFSFTGEKIASFDVLINGEELNSNDPGARNNPINISLNPEELKAYEVNLSLGASEKFSFKYPVVVKVEYKKSPLQGAIRWIGEDQNPTLFTLNSSEENLSFQVSALGTCDSVNQPDGSCKDYAHIQIFNADDMKKPVAKKRFYLKISPK
jgi:hypothetical protein